MYILSNYIPNQSYLGFTYFCYSGIHPRMPEVRPQDKLMHQEDLRPP